MTTILLLLAFAFALLLCLGFEIRRGIKQDGRLADHVRIERMMRETQQQMRHERAELLLQVNDLRGLNAKLEAEHALCSQKPEKPKTTKLQIIGSPRWSQVKAREEYANNTKERAHERLVNELAGGINESTE